MKTKQLGNSDLFITPIGFGAWAIGGGGWEFAWGTQDDSDSISAIHEALNAGVNWIDTAAVYGLGHSEEVVARALGYRKNRPYVFTKCSMVWDERREIGHCLKADSIRRECEASLRRLRVEAIDLYQIHWPDPSVSFAATAETLARLADEGKIRHVGVSNFDAGQIAELSRTRAVETLQPPYSLFNRELEAAVLPYCREHEIGVLVYGPLAHGLLTGAMSPETSFAEDDWRRVSPSLTGDTFHRNLEIVDQLASFAAERGWKVSQLAIAWTLAHPGIHVAIVGSRSRTHIEESLGALEIHFSERELGEIENIIADAATIEEATPETMTELMGLA
jgi:aryl-alcohol dehydrogenase-like predicted oxidoreductase